jgi:2-oxoglutarate dehydrogenase E1 component
MAEDKDFVQSPKTAITKTTFLSIANQIATLPADKKFFNKIEKLFNDRKNMIANNSYDWAMGELMAYASLITEGHSVRFTGQDVERGTFSHRHAVVKVEDSEEEYTPLNNVKENKGDLRIFNSHLSEYAVLGFEYGYAFASPNMLTIWEAQFGDFFNGAQIVIDQFIASGEAKWRRMNGLVMLLPHGYEGQGPEHSSARMERFLQMCAENNMQIVNTTTPAQQFHVLRRQLNREFRKPLICFTPKKLLRYPTCISTMEDFTTKGFVEVIDDANADAKKVTRIIFCTGKVYYDLDETRTAKADTTTAIVRVEQLYPFPTEQVNALIKKYSKASNYIWVQEEPENMGAYVFVARKFSVKLNYVGRPESASPATGFYKTHDKQTAEILGTLFK